MLFYPHSVLPQLPLYHGDRDNDDNKTNDSAAQGAGTNGIDGADNDGIIGDNTDGIGGDNTDGIGGAAPGLNPSPSQNS